MDKVTVIIQARMGSLRLPGKVLMPLGDTIVLDYVVQRSRAIEGVSEVIVATSSLKQDQVIVNWCIEHGVPYFCGSEDDVLDRYYQCAKLYEPDYVIRVTADCPFADYQTASAMVAMLENRKQVRDREQVRDCKQIDHSHQQYSQREMVDVVRLEPGLPRGLPVELLSFAALRYIHQNGTEVYHREHVTYYAYEFPEKFRFYPVAVEDAKKRPDLRITLDTPEDYLLCQAIADHFVGNILVSAQDVIDYLASHPEIVELNAHIQQKAVK